MNRHTMAYAWRNLVIYGAASIQYDTIYLYSMPSMYS
jgi:hypothetical protein